jgi:hypothetical protein
MFGKENYNPPEHQEQLHEQSNKKKCGTNGDINIESGSLNIQFVIGIAKLKRLNTGKDIL